MATLEFSEFKLEPGQGSSCTYDRVRIYDGPDERAPLISTHCGNSLPVPIEGTSNRLYVTFTSDGSVQDQGFVVTYAAKEHVHVDDNEGTLSNNSRLFFLHLNRWSSQTFLKEINQVKIKSYLSLRLSVLQPFFSSFVYYWLVIISDEPPCGIPKVQQKTLKIVGGAVADRHAFPWQISLGYCCG